MKRSSSLLLWLLLDGWPGVGLPWPWLALLVWLLPTPREARRQTSYVERRTSEKTAA